MFKGRCENGSSPGRGYRRASRSRTRRVNGGGGAPVSLGYWAMEWPQTKTTMSFRIKEKCILRLHYYP
jgi:hypothetical protein